MLHFSTALNEYLSTYKRNFYHWCHPIYSVVDVKDQLTAISADPNNENPKLSFLKNVILSYFKENTESCGIVFVKTREMTVALMNWMQATPEMKKLNPHNLVGSNAPSQKAGSLLADILHIACKNTLNTQTHQQKLPSIRQSTCCYNVTECRFITVVAVVVQLVKATWNYLRHMVRKNCKTYMFVIRQCKKFSVL